MKINFYYCYINNSINNLMILYNKINKIKTFYKDKKIDINLVDVSTINLCELEKSTKHIDVCVIDVMMKAIFFHEQNKVPYNTIIKNIKSRDHYVASYEILSSAKCCKIFFAQSFDLHDHKIDIDSLNKFDALFWLYEKSPLGPQAIPIQYHEKWFFEYEDTISVWEKIRSKIKSRAEVPFSIDASQSTIKNKYFDYVIAGCNYQTRLIAANSFRNTSLRKAPYHYGEYLAASAPSYLKRIGIPENFINHYYINFRRFNYTINIERSLVSFACGSGLCYPVRKFFQIPSLGSLLLSYPCVGFKDYGFINGINCIVTTPEDAAKDTLNIFSKKWKMEKIIQNGFNFVKKEHSLDNRLEQLIECIKKVASGKNINAQYIEGKYEIQEI